MMTLFSKEKNNNCTRLCGGVFWLSETQVQMLLYAGDVTTSKSVEIERHRNKWLLDQIVFIQGSLKHVCTAGPGSGMNKFNIKKLKSEGRATQTAANLMLNVQPVFGFCSGLRSGGILAKFWRSCFRDLWGLLIENRGEKTSQRFFSR